MENANTPLSQDERAELEQLRAEKAARDDRDKRRAELDRQRDERDKWERESNERARRLMEPGDDLSMPVAQKIVLAAVALLVLAVVAMYLFSPR